MQLYTSLKLRKMPDNKPEIIRVLSELPDVQQVMFGVNLDVQVIFVIWTYRHHEANSEIQKALVMATVRDRLPWLLDCLY